MSEVAAKPNFPSLRLLLITVWALLVVWMPVGAILGPDAMGVIPPGVRTSPTYRFLLFSLNLWGLVAGTVPGLVGFNPFGWLNGKRLIFVSMAFAMVLGRLWVGWLAPALMFVPVPEVTSFLAAPFVLLFGFFAAVPVILFNQIFAFEVALAQYRYHARGLGGYIARAIFWLRNEPLPELPPDEANGARFATAAEIKALQNPAPESVAFRPAHGEPFVRFDNAHAAARPGGRFVKGPKAHDHWHRHESDPGRPYAFTTGAQLLDDFWREVKRAMDERGIPNDL